eukprot:208946-Amphidinium_carterae.1
MACFFQEEVAARQCLVDKLRGTSFLKVGIINCNLSCAACVGRVEASRMFKESSLIWPELLHLTLGRKFDVT